MYDVIIRGGDLIDPAQGIHGVQSLAITEGKIAAIGSQIIEEKAKKIIDAKGKIITPGLIDIHCHPVAGLTFFGVPADEVGINNGVALVCDGGSAGSSNFSTLREFVFAHAKTDWFCFLNVAKTGLIKFPEIVTQYDVDLNETRRVVENNRGVIKGLKIRAIQALAEGLGIKIIEASKKLANDLKVPVMLHLGEIRERVENDKMDEFSRAAVSLLEARDILLHYATWAAGGMILKNGTIYRELEAAQKRGVLLDPSPGMNNFSFAAVRHGLSKGIIPDVISTDISTMGLLVLQSLPVVMSKFLCLGLSLDQVVRMTTINAARALSEDGKRGTLKPGMDADISIFELLKGDYLFGDGGGRGSLRGDSLLEPRMVFKAGKAMPAYSNYHVPPLFS